MGDAAHCADPILAQGTFPARNSSQSRPWLATVGNCFLYLSQVSSGNSVQLFSRSVHPVQPHIGFTVAIEDAWVLIQRLRRAWDQGMPLTSGLRDYEQSRLARINRLWRSSHFVNSLVSLPPGLSHGRDLVLGAIPASVKSRVFHEVLGYSLGPPLNCDDSA